MFKLELVLMSLFETHWHAVAIQLISSHRDCDNFDRYERTYSSAQIDFTSFVVI